MNSKLLPLSLAVMLASATGCASQGNVIKSPDISKNNDFYENCPSAEAAGVTVLSPCPKKPSDETARLNNYVLSGNGGPFSTGGTSLVGVIHDQLIEDYKKDIYKDGAGNNPEDRAWTRSDFNFLDDDYSVKKSPGNGASNDLNSYSQTSVNPSLLRQAVLNNEGGLYKINDDVYQVRGLDMSVMTLIRGEDGWIVVDPLTSKENAPT